MQKQYLNKNLSFQERAKALVSEMTIEEKASQTRYDSPAIERLGIPAYNWWNEALHGVARAGTATVFPQAIGMAATFDEELIYQVADVISTEARAKYNMQSALGDRDIYKGLTMWSPNINIFRDPRWGRGHETYGEDPYLTARLGVAFVKGLQGDGKYLKAAACAKHFAVHSGPENLRHEFNAVVTKKDLWETYLPAFEALAKEAKVEGFMGAYNRTNGEPCCGSQSLKEILTERWGFHGYFVSDCWAIRDFHEYHMVTSNALESVAMALKNGCDLNCGNMYVNMLLALQEGLIEEADITAAVERLMETRIRLGMFDETEFDKIPYSVVACKAHRELALQVARQSLVLLKNDGILPLSKDKKVAVIGPNANSTTVLLGNYNGTPKKYVTVLEGIYNMIGEEQVSYSIGCHLYRDRVEVLAQAKDRFAEAVAIAMESDVIIMCMGLDSAIEGEQGDASNEYAAGDKRDLNLPAIQQQLLETIVAVGKPIIFVSLTGSAMDYTYVHNNCKAVLQGWYPGAEGGQAIAELIFGEFCPSGKLPVTFYQSTEDLPDFCDYSMKNRTYRYFDGEVLYPFGFGLSYTSFEYSNLKLDKYEIKAGESIEASITVKNTGEYDGDEIAQAYLKDMEASFDVPKYKLIHFKKVKLRKGEEKTIEFTINQKDMENVNDDGESVLEPGNFEIFVGGGQPQYAKTQKARFSVS